jgi:hypothetical protein
MSDQPPLRPAQAQLSSQAIRALGAIILTAIAGIIMLSAWSLALRAGVLPSEDEAAAALNAGSADEALSILGNIASASVGGLVGWLTRDIVVRGQQVSENVLEETPGDEGMTK